jgi:hypothetical protein
LKILLFGLCNGTCSTREGEKYITFLAEKNEGLRSLGRARRSQECNIKTDFKEIGYEGAYWIHVA